MPASWCILTEVMNGIGTAVRRPVDYMHIPVPREHTDPTYLEPLRHWIGGQTGQLSIGLIHHGSEQGNRTRIAAAQSTVPEFGIASECGWGRSKPARRLGSLHGHRAAAELLAD